MGGDEGSGRQEDVERQEPERGHPPEAGRHDLRAEEPLVKNQPVHSLHRIQFEPGRTITGTGAESWKNEICGCQKETNNGPALSTGGKSQLPSFAIRSWQAPAPC